MRTQEAAHVCLLAMEGLRPAEGGMLVDALALICRHDGPISREELRELEERRPGSEADRRAFSRQLRTLIRKGKLHVTEEGLLDANPVVVEAFAAVMAATYGPPPNDAP